MGIKGKTTFELTDVNTGEVEVIEDNNMITNGLQEFLTTYGLFGCDILGGDLRTSQLWCNLLGGLFLFDTALDENVDNTFMPAGVKMVGNGSYKMSNSGDVTEMGSYNESESGVQDDGSIRMVYDFSTQQANGTIACACLTSKIGGYAGMGNESAKYYNKGYILNYFLGDICYGGITGADTDFNHVLYASYGENAIYCTNPYNLTYSAETADQHWSVTGKIQILKVRAGFNSVDIKESCYFKQVMESYEVDIPQDILAYMGTKTNYTIFSSDGMERNIFIIFCTNSSSYVNNGVSFWVMKIDKDMNVTSYKVTNNTGTRINVSRKYITFDGDYLWTNDYSNGGLLGIKYADSTQIVETPVNRTSFCYLYKISKNLIGVGNGDNHYTVYDAVNNTERLVNGETNSYQYYNYIPFADKKGVYMIINTSHSKQYKYEIMKDPRYLATINNLPEPVVKTASKTMKVTYTLTFEG